MYGIIDIIIYFLFFIIGYNFIPIIIRIKLKYLIPLQNENFSNILRRKCYKNNIINNVLCGICVAFTYSLYKPIEIAMTVLLFILLLVVISSVDIATMEIPNPFVIAALVLGIISIFTMPGTSLPSRILGMFVVSVPLLLITLLVPGAFGGGDIKLMAACGLFLGTKLTLLSFAFAVLTGGLYGIWLLVMKKKSGKEHFAFGPFLCLGMAAALFIGDKVWDWYAGLLYL